VLDIGEVRCGDKEPVAEAPSMRGIVYDEVVEVDGAKKFPL
jgi:hypothetical protein